MIPEWLIDDTGEVREGRPGSCYSETEKATGLRFKLNQVVTVKPSDHPLDAAPVDSPQLMCQNNRFRI